MRILAVLLVLLPVQVFAQAVQMQETVFWQSEVKSGSMDPIELRMPSIPI